MSEDKKPPPDEYSSFRELLDKIAKVPKQEIEQAEREYQDREKPTKKRAP